MDLVGNEVVVVLIEDESGASIPSSCSVSPIALCRICLEEEEESSTSMETPCACAGTLKFAHRRCVQRWCDEKGSTLCEVCLQNFEPNYTVAPKKALIEVGVTIRQSVEVITLEGYRLPTSPLTATLFEEDDDAAECSPASRRSATYCQSITLTLTLLLLLRYLISVVTIGAENYAFTILAVFLLRMTGILLPLYALVRIASAIKQIQRDRWAMSLPEIVENREDLLLREDSQSPQHMVQIHS